MKTQRKRSKTEKDTCMYKRATEGRNDKLNDNKVRGEWSTRDHQLLWDMFYKLLSSSLLSHSLTFPLFWAPIPVSSQVLFPLHLMSDSSIKIIDHNNQRATGGTRQIRKVRNNSNLLMKPTNLPERRTTSLAICQLNWFWTYLNKGTFRSIFHLLYIKSVQLTWCDLTLLIINVGCH